IKREYEQRLCTQAVQGLEHATCHSDFLKHFAVIEYIAEMYPALFEQLICVKPSFNATLEKFLKVVPSSMDDFRVFVHISNHVARLLETGDESDAALLKLADHIAQCIRSEYIPWLRSLGGSVAGQEKERMLPTQTNTRVRSEMSAMKTCVVGHMFELLDAWLTFSTRTNVINTKKEHELAFREILHCIVVEMETDLDAQTQQRRWTHAWIHRTTRMYLSLQCLHNVFRSTTSAIVRWRGGTSLGEESAMNTKKTPNPITKNPCQRILVHEQHNILNHLLNIITKTYVTNSFQFFHLFRLGLLCLDCFCSSFVKDTTGICAYRKNISWLLRFFSHRDVVTRTLAVSVLSGLIRSSAADTYSTPLENIILSHSDLGRHLFRAITCSAHALLQAQALDCLNLVLNEYLRCKRPQSRVDMDTRLTELSCMRSKDGTSKKQERERETKTTRPLLSSQASEIIETTIVNQLCKQLNIRKLLYNSYGNALYFKSLLVLIKTLIVFQIGEYNELIHDCVYFAQFQLLLNMKEFKERFVRHFELLDVPVDYKHPKCSEMLCFCLFFFLFWNSSGEDIHRLATGVAIVDIFNCILEKMRDNENHLQNKDRHVESSIETTDKRRWANRSAFCDRIFEEPCFTPILTLLVNICERKEYELVIPIFNFYTNLLEFQPKRFRLAMYKACVPHVRCQHIDPQSQECWFEEFLLEQIAMCLLESEFL
ncbi:hypothetical protein RFI_14801, partial [Reticulomyxa filosa]